MGNEDLGRFKCPMPDLKYAEIDTQVISPSLPDGVANAIPYMTESKLSSGDVVSAKQLSASKEAVTFSQKGYRAN